MKSLLTKRCKVTTHPNLTLNPLLFCVLALKNISKPELFDPKLGTLLNNLIHFLVFHQGCTLASHLSESSELLTTQFTFLF